MNVTLHVGQGKLPAALQIVVVDLVIPKGRNHVPKTKSKLLALLSQESLSCQAGGRLTWKNSEKKSENPRTSVNLVETSTLGILRSGMAPV